MLGINFCSWLKAVESMLKRRLFMIVVTGGAGFIGSAFVWELNQAGITNVVIVDDLQNSDKWHNLVGLQFEDYLHKDDFLDFISEDELPYKISAVVHMGACSATTETDMDYLMENNYQYTVILAQWALANKARFIYASSGATYGDGVNGFCDGHEGLESLRPLNRYGYSKHLFDLYAKRNNLLDKIVGLKFFNVFGPNEYHKGDMRSVVCKAYDQIRQTGRLKLFKSYQPQYADGSQMRDFVYVKDCVAVMKWLLDHPKVNGIYNVGTGIARTWLDLGNAIFKAMDLAPQIDFIEMPDALKAHYQYYTQADISKLKGTGCPVEFRLLEDSVRDYVAQYLQRSACLDSASVRKGFA